jgi:alpha-tubulin suppressor-like RCC1 family protein
MKNPGMCPGATWHSSFARLTVAVLMVAGVAAGPSVVLAQTDAAGSAATSIRAGWSDSCAVVAGQAECWGLNDHGQLGNQSTVDSSTPAAVVGVEDVSAIAPAGDHACAIVSGGRVACWGYNGHGELGDRTTTSSLKPVVVSGLGGAVTIAAGGRDTYDGDYTCVVVFGGNVECWGRNESGQLGDGTTSDSLGPVAVEGITGATAIAAGAWDTCAIVTGGAVECWGDNHSGELGDGSTAASLTAVRVVGLSDAVSVAVGTDHACAAVVSGTVYCWGYGADGDLGHSVNVLSSTPVSVTGLTGAVAVAAGEGYSCAIVAGGEVRCWGFDDIGQLGNGTVSEATSSAIVKVVGVSGAESITAQGYHTCVIVAAGAVECWGDGEHGGLGNGEFRDSSRAVSVLGLGKETAPGPSSPGTSAASPIGSWNEPASRGAPASSYATFSPSSAMAASPQPESPQRSTSDGSALYILVGLAVIAAAGVGVGAVMIARRRRGSGPARPS